MTREPSLPTFSLFWKKQVLPVFGLFPMIAMSLKRLVFIMPGPVSSTLRHKRIQLVPSAFSAVVTVTPG